MGLFSKGSKVARSGNEQAEQRGTGLRRWPKTPLICVALIIAAQWTSPWTDHQVANIVTAILGLIALIALLIRWFYATSGKRFLRYSPLVLILLGIAFAATQYELIGFNGEMVPQFRKRNARSFIAASSSARQAQRQAQRHAQRQGPETAWKLTANGFSGFLGPARTGRIALRTFSTDWTTPPTKLWNNNIGGGLAGVAIVSIASNDVESPEADLELSNLRAVTIEQRDQEEWVTCYNVATGDLLWHHSEPGRHSHLLGDLGPRSTPAIDSAGRVFAMGATGHLWCLDGATGNRIWRADLLEIAEIDQSASEEGVRWGRAASPLLVDDLVIVPLGGSAGQGKGIQSLIAFQASNGTIRWTAGTNQISYASPVLATIAGIRQIIHVEQDFVTGYAVEDGKILWTHPWDGKSNGKASCSNPIPLDKDSLLLSKGYGGGAQRLLLTNSENIITPTIEWSESRVLKTKFTNVLVDGAFGYALSDGALECVDLSTGAGQWKQGRSGRYGHGQMLLVEDVLLITSETGELALVAADPKELRELAKIQAIEGKTWNTPAIYGSIVIVRNGLEMAAWQLPPRI